MSSWTVKKQDGIFRIAEQMKHADRMWRDDPEQIVMFPPDASVDEVIDRMVAILQDATRKPS
jgi:hypothetical protein